MDFILVNSFQSHLQVDFVVLFSNKMAISSFSTVALLCVLCVAAATAKTEVTCAPDDTLLPDPDSCDHFYMCNAGTAYLFECPTLLLWNRRISQCDFSDNTDCSSGSPKETTALVTSETSAATTRKTTVVPVTTNIPVTTTQASKQTTQPPKQTTQPPTTTTAAPVKPDTTTEAAQPPSDLTCLSVALFFYEPLPGSCTQFYLCSNGVFKGIHSCGAGLIFNRAQQACLTPSKTQCPN